jgi:hypothetical protein
VAAFLCPSCGHFQGVEDAHVGKMTKCPKCRTQGRVTSDNEELLPFLSADGSDRIADAEVAVRRSSGGSIQTKLSAKIILNEGSSLQREWVTVSDPAMPARLVGVTGIRTHYDTPSDYRAGGYCYKSDYTFTTDIDLRAVHVRFLTFDVWGEHVRTLAATEIRDFAPNSSNNLAAEWAIYYENETSDFCASVAYLARVRTSDGKVVTADTTLVIEEARRFSELVKEADLEPSKPPQK